MWLLLFFLYLCSRLAIVSTKSYIKEKEYLIINKSNDYTYNFYYCRFRARLCTHCHRRATKVNKAAIALLMLVGCWTLYMMDPMQYLQLMHPDYTGGAAGMVEKVTGIIQEHLGDTATTLFFLMGAMTIVEIVDQNGGFNWVRKVMKTKSKRALLWRIAFLTFFLSAILDNLTTSIVMIMILRKFSSPTTRTAWFMHPSSSSQPIRVVLSLQSATLPPSCSGTRD